MNRKFRLAITGIVAFLFIFNSCEFPQGIFETGYEIIQRHNEEDKEKEAEEFPGQITEENGNEDATNEENDESQDSESDAETAGSTENPEDTETAGSTENPEDTETAGSTENPEDTETAGSTENPEDTETAGSTENPEDTETAGSTENPEDTESTETTENPETTETTEISEATDSEEPTEDSEDIIEETMQPPYLSTVEERIWTILVYMPADNNLEAAALEDLREMERSEIDADKVTILALIDRSSSYDYSDNNWIGTRMYKVKTGQSKLSSQIMSEEINCINLGLSKGTETELDMSSPYTLSGAMKYALDRFPAEHYGFVMWGHGTGWRNSEEDSCGYKGFAYDEKSGTYMTLRQMGSAFSQALSGNKLDFLGFDTCFGGELEVMYELRDYAKTAVGSEGLVSASGWNYEKLFNRFALSPTCSPQELCHAVVSQFAEDYRRTSRASISSFDLSRMSDFCNSFNLCCNQAGKLINSRKVRDEIMNLIYYSSDTSVQRYSYGLEGYDVYLDSLSLLNAMNSYFSDNNYKQLYQKFIEEYENAVLESWTSDTEENGGPGVYFATLAAGGFLSNRHPASYIKGKTINQLDFINDMSGWVPSVSGNSGLLNKLFYTEF